VASDISEQHRKDADEAAAAAREPDATTSEETGPEPAPPLSRYQQARKRGNEAFVNVIVGVGLRVLVLILALMLIPVMVELFAHGLNTVIEGATLLLFGLFVFAVIALRWDLFTAAITTTLYGLAFAICNSHPFHAGVWGYHYYTFTWVIEGPRYFLYGALVAIFGLWVAEELVGPSRWRWVGLWMIPLVPVWVIAFFASRNELGAEHQGLWLYSLATAIFVVVLLIQVHFTPSDTSDTPPPRRSRTAAVRSDSAVTAEAHEDTDPNK
jgi:hypothetical protein